MAHEIITLYKNIIGEVAMIGGIFGTIGKTLGIGKEKYFLELDDAAEESLDSLKEAATKVTKVAKETAADIADKAQELTEGATDKVQEVAGKTANKTQKATGKTADKAKAKAQKTAVAGKVKAKQAADELMQAGEEAASKVGEKAAATTGKAADTKKAQTAPQPRDAEDIIREALAANSNPAGGTGNAAGGAHNFATDYLMPKTSSRRRPGPSLKEFKSMAKDVNPRLK